MEFEVPEFITKTDAEIREFEAIQEKARRNAYNSYLEEHFGKYPKKYKSFIFSNYDSEVKDKWNFELCKTFVKQFPSYANIVMKGNIGAGKTFLTCCIINELKKKYNVLMIQSIDLFDMLKSGIGDGTLAEKMSILKSVRLLAVDDVGKENTSKFVLERWFEIINDRYLTERPVILTTNLTHKDLAKHLGGDAIWSRFIERSIIMRFSGDNYRYKIATENWKGGLK